MQVGSYMNSEAVFRIIDQAKETEFKTRRFEHQLSGKLRQLHLVIGIHDEAPAQCLLHFAIEYIEMAPRVIECVEACAKEARVESLFAPFISTAINYFIHPSLFMLNVSGLDGLLMKAYLCHRLLEEMYENNKTIRNSHLCDIGVIQANLLAHQLIGEPFANELDESVLLSLREIAGNPDYYNLNLEPFIAQAQHQAWQWMRDYWEALLKRNHIEMHFSYRSVY